MDYAKLISLATKSSVLADWQAKDPEGYKKMLSAKAEAEKINTRLGKFFDSLTPEQRAVWEKLNRFGNDSRQDELLEFFTSLTDEQRALLNGVCA